MRHVFAVSFALAISNGGAALAADDEFMAWGCASAAYFGETTEYRHGVLGDDVEWKGLYTTWLDGDDVAEARIVLPEGQVFEDLEPRCGDFNGDGTPDPVTIISDAWDGARLAIYIKGQLAVQTPPIGRGFRWLAPVGVFDFNGDGDLDVAYVEKPHIGGTLYVWSYRDGELIRTAALSGFSNHKIGQDYITGGVRHCGDGPELVLPNFNWSRLVSVKLSDEGLVPTDIGTETNRVAVARALECRS